MLLHWLSPGKELWEGLSVLHVDSACVTMSNTVKHGVAEVYVEAFEDEETQFGSSDVLEVQHVNTQQSVNVRQDVDIVDVDEESSDDSDYLPGDMDNSEEDEKGDEIRRQFKAYEKKI